MSPAPDAVPGTLRRLSDLLEMIPEDGVVFIDHKATSTGGGKTDDGENLVALLDYLTIPNAANRFVWKAFKCGYLSADVARTRGYRSWGIYDGDESATAPTRAASFDILGMEHGDDEGEWDVALATGKAVVGHIIDTAGQRNSAVSKGADGIMNSNILSMPEGG